jgi:Zn-dependent alcohol dehydrogenase
MTPLQLSLLAVSAAISAAKAATINNPQAQTILGYLEVGDNAVQSALTAIQQAQQAVDPNALKPIDPIA